MYQNNPKCSGQQLATLEQKLDSFHGLEWLQQGAFHLTNDQRLAVNSVVGGSENAMKYTPIVLVVWSEACHATGSV